MADIGLEWTPEGIDVALRDDDIAEDEGLRTAALLSVLMDRRAADDDQLPSPGDLRGWWGDELAGPEGDRIGSRLWLLSRSAAEPGVARRAKAVAEDGLAWLIEDGVASSVDVSAELVDGDLSIDVTIHRPHDEDIDVRFARVWDSLAAERRIAEVP